MRAAHGAWLVAWWACSTLACAAPAHAPSPVHAASRAAAPAPSSPSARPRHSETQSQVPGAAKVAFGIGALGLAGALFAISAPADDEERHGTPSTVAGVSAGVGAAGLAVGSVLVLVTPRPSSPGPAVAVGPGALRISGDF